MNPKVLITGYKPFKDVKENVSEKVVQSLSCSVQPSVISLVMPVEWRPVRKSLLNIIRKERPDIVVGFGHSLDAETLRLEPILLNCSIFKDEAGKFPSTPYIIKNEPEGRKVEIPFEQLSQYLNENGVPTIINQDPLSMLFLCGYAAYLERYYADKYCGKDTLTVFIHLPPPEKLEFETIMKGVELVIKFLIDFRTQIK